ncbi:carbonic anhydrase [Streptomyces sp. NP160]|uniref:beta-class carbonic anhydrase n=1 Tax=Streptomyces sp. NP160 TaxID=2586637 RepID=UPI001117F300|nr:carbonic anhydrase [Streptomyces sp. NP160]TNM67925.1 carbonic anhydrase [Streptomyces sp. NP160]
MEETTAVDRLVAQAEYYAAAFYHGHLPGPPALRTTVVTCMDARINPYGLLGLTEGDAHVLRNAGGSATDDVLRSLAVSQRELGTREVVVIQHTGCGMATFDGEEFRARVLRETGVEPPWSSTGTFGDVEQNVRDSVARIQGDPALPHRDRVRGFVYDVLSGTLAEVRPVTRRRLVPGPLAPQHG